jgi:hypothetical protein
MIEIKYNKSNWNCLDPIIRLEQEYLGQDMNQWVRVDGKIIIDFGFYSNKFIIFVIEAKNDKIAAEDWDKPLEKVVIDDLVTEKVIQYLTKLFIKYDI